MKLLVSLILASGVGAHQFPIPPVFSASIQVHPQTFSQDAGGPSPFAGGHVKMDWHSQTQSWELYSNKYAWVGPDFANFSLKQVLIQGRATMSDHNGSTCGPVVNPFYGTMLTLLAQMPDEGSFEGASTVFDVACDIWTVRNNSTGNLSTCIDHDGVPRSIVVEPLGDAVGWSNVGAFAHNFTLHDIVTGDDANLGGIEPLSCWLDDVWRPRHWFDWICHKPVRNMQVLRGMSDPEPLGILEDRDTCDWVGQGVTLGSPDHSSFAGQQYLQMFDVDVDGRFGFWRDCNYNRDLGRNVCEERPSIFNYDKLISRCSCEMLEGERLMGMCEDDLRVGHWLTFPHEGKCAESANVGDDGCTWKLVNSKAILMDCMKAFNSSGWERAWEIDTGKAPFPNVMAHVQAAVEACPDVRENILTA